MKRKLLFSINNNNKHKNSRDLVEMSNPKGNIINNFEGNNEIMNSHIKENDYNLIYALKEIEKRANRDIAFEEDTEDSKNYFRDVVNNSRKRSSSYDNQRLTSLVNKNSTFKKRNFSNSKVTNKLKIKFNTTNVTVNKDNKPFIIDRTHKIIMNTKYDINDVYNINKQRIITNYYRNKKKNRNIETNKINSKYGYVRILMSILLLKLTSFSAKKHDNIIVKHFKKMLNLFFYFFISYFLAFIVSTFNYLFKISSISINMILDYITNGSSFRSQRLKNNKLILEAYLACIKDYFKRLKNFFKTYLVSYLVVLKKSIFHSKHYKFKAILSLSFIRSIFIRVIKEIKGRRVVDQAHEFKNIEIKDFFCKINRLVILLIILICLIIGSEFHLQYSIVFRSSGILMNILEFLYYSYIKTYEAVVNEKLILLIFSIIVINVSEKYIRMLSKDKAESVNNQDTRSKELNNSNTNNIITNNNINNLKLKSIHLCKYNIENTMKNDIKDIEKTNSQRASNFLSKLLINLLAFYIFVVYSTILSSFFPSFDTYFPLILIYYLTESNIFSFQIFMFLSMLWNILKLSSLSRSDTLIESSILSYEYLSSLIENSSKVSFITINNYKCLINSTNHNEYKFSFFNYISEFIFSILNIKSIIINYLSTIIKNLLLPIILHEIIVYNVYNTKMNDYKTNVTQDTSSESDYVSDSNKNIKVGYSILNNKQEKSLSMIVSTNSFSYYSNSNPKTKSLLDKSSQRNSNKMVEIKPSLDNLSLNLRQISYSEYNNSKHYNNNNTTRLILDELEDKSNKIEIRMKTVAYKKRTLGDGISAVFQDKYDFKNKRLNKKFETNRLDKYLPKLPNNIKSSKQVESGKLNTIREFQNKRILETENKDSFNYKEFNNESFSNFVYNNENEPNLSEFAKASISNIKANTNNNIALNNKSVNKNNNAIVKEKDSIDNQDNLHNKNYMISINNNKINTEEINNLKENLSKKRNNSKSKNSNKHIYSYNDNKGDSGKNNHNNSNCIDYKDNDGNIKDDHTILTVNKLFKQSNSLNPTSKFSRSRFITFSNKNKDNMANININNQPIYINTNIFLKSANEYDTKQTDKIYKSCLLSPNNFGFFNNNNINMNDMNNNYNNYNNYKKLTSIKSKSTRSLTNVNYSPKGFLKSTNYGIITFKIDSLISLFNILKQTSTDIEANTNVNINKEANVLTEKESILLEKSKLEMEIVEVNKALTENNVNKNRQTISKTSIQNIQQQNNSYINSNISNLPGIANANNSHDIFNTKRTSNSKYLKLVFFNKFIESLKQVVVIPQLYKEDKIINSLNNSFSDIKERKDPCYNDVNLNIININDDRLKSNTKLLINDSSNSKIKSNDNDNHINRNNENDSVHNIYDLKTIQENKDSENNDLNSKQNIKLFSFNKTYSSNLTKNTVKNYTKQNSLLHSILTDNKLKKNQTNVSKKSQNTDNRNRELERISFNSSSLDVSSLDNIKDTSLDKINNNNLKIGPMTDPISNLKSLNEKRKNKKNFKPLFNEDMNQATPTFERKNPKKFESKHNIRLEFDNKISEFNIEDTNTPQSYNNVNNKNKNSNMKLEYTNKRKTKPEIQNYTTIRNFTNSLENKVNKNKINEEMNYVEGLMSLLIKNKESTKSIPVRQDKIFKNENNNINPNNISILNNLPNTPKNLDMSYISANNTVLESTNNLVNATTLNIKQNNISNYNKNLKEKLMTNKARNISNNKNLKNKTKNFVLTSESINNKKIFNCQDTLKTEISNFINSFILCNNSSNDKEQIDYNEKYLFLGEYLVNLSNNTNKYYDVYIYSYFVEKDRNNLGGITSEKSINSHIKYCNANNDKARINKENFNSSIMKSEIENKNSYYQNYNNNTLSNLSNVEFTKTKRKESKIEFFASNELIIELHLFEISDLVNQREKAVNESKAKIENFAHVAHEFKTPLNAVIMLAGNIKNTDINSPTSLQKTINDVEYIKNIAVYSSYLITDFTQTTKNTNKLVKLNLKTSNLKEILVFCIKITETLIDFYGNSSVKSKLEIDKELEDKKITTDEVKLKQVLLNFLSNSVKFTKKGCISVQASYDQLEKKVNIKLKDTGLGIKRDQLEKIQTARYNELIIDEQINKSGSGYGMNIAMKILCKLNYSFVIDSVENKGTTIELEIDVSNEEDFGNVNSNKNNNNMILNSLSVNSTSHKNSSNTNNNEVYYNILNNKKKSGYVFKINSDNIQKENNSLLVKENSSYTNKKPSNYNKTNLSLSKKNPQQRNKTDLAFSNKSTFNNLDSSLDLVKKSESNQFQVKKKISSRLKEYMEDLDNSSTSKVCNPEALNNCTRSENKVSSSKTAETKLHVKSKKVLIKVDNTNENKNSKSSKNNKLSFTIEESSKDRSSDKTLKRRRLKRNSTTKQTIFNYLSDINKNKSCINISPPKLIINPVKRNSFCYNPLQSYSKCFNKASEIMKFRHNFKKDLFRIESEGESSYNSKKQEKLFQEFNRKVKKENLIGNTLNNNISNSNIYNNSIYSNNSTSSNKKLSANYNKRTVNIYKSSKSKLRSSLSSYDLEYPGRNKTCVSDFDTTIIRKSMKLNDEYFANIFLQSNKTKLIYEKTKTKKAFSNKKLISHSVQNRLSDKQLHFKLDNQDVIVEKDSFFNSTYISRKDGFNNSLFMPITKSSHSNLMIFNKYKNKTFSTDNEHFHVNLISNNMNNANLLKNNQSISNNNNINNISDISRISPILDRNDTAYLNNKKIIKRQELNNNIQNTSKPSVNYNKQIRDSSVYNSNNNNKEDKMTFEYSDFISSSELKKESTVNNVTNKISSPTELGQINCLKKNKETESNENKLVLCKNSDEVNSEAETERKNYDLDVDTLVKYLIDTKLKEDNINNKKKFLFEEKSKCYSLIRLLLFLFLLIFRD